jgi:glycosyltransferase involved in cell wall biosynthesis
MKIAILDSYFQWPPKGGGIRDVKEVASGLVKKGYEVTLIIPDYDFRGKINDTNDLDFEIYKIGFNKVNFNAFNLYRKIKKALKTTQPNMVIVGNGNQFRPYMVLAARNYPTIVRLFGYEFICPLNGLLFKNNRVCKSNFILHPYKCLFCLSNNRYELWRRYNAEFFRSFAFIYPFYYALVKKSLILPQKYIVYSEYMKRNFSEVIPTQKLEVIPGGVDPNEFAPIERKSEKIKKIFFPCRAWDPLKGLDVLVKAGSILWKKRKDFNILVTGNSFMSLDKYPFVIHENWKIGQNLAMTYAMSDIVVVPSIWAEPFGLAALEGMSCGTAVIASEIGGLTDFVEDGKTGILVPPGDSEALASKIDELLNDEEYRLKLGATARKVVLQNYSYSQIVNKYISIIEEL